MQKVEGLTNGMGLGLGHQQGAGLSDISAQVHQYQQFLGKTNTKCRSSFLIWTYNLTLHQLFECVCVSDASRSLPEFPELKDEGKPLPDGLHPQHVHTYQLIYREHCEVSVCAGCQMCGYFSVLVSNVCVCVCL